VDLILKICCGTDSTGGYSNKMKCEKCFKQHNGAFGSGRFCSRSCANSRIPTKESNQKRRETIKRKIKEGIIIPHQKLVGNKNPNYKENGGHRHNKENALKTFDKYKGICQKCKVQLIKEKYHTWVAHHNNLELTFEEYNDDVDRTLYCHSCHTSWHNKNYPKKHQLGKKRMLSL